MCFEEDRLGSDCWESATKHMSWDHIYNSYRSYPVSSVLHHTEGQNGAGIWGYQRVVRRYKWSGTRGNYCRLRILCPSPRGFADYLYVVLFMHFLYSGEGNRKMVSVICTQGSTAHSCCQISAKLNNSIVLFCSSTFMCSKIEAVLKGTGCRCGLLKCAHWLKVQWYKYSQATRW